MKKEPQSADAWEQLASAYAGAQQLDQAVNAQKHAIALDPDSLPRIRSLIALQSQAGETTAAITTLQAYTARHPRSSDAFLDLAQLAEQAKKTALARLSYQAFLRLSPDDPNAAAIKAKIKSLQ